MRCSSRMVQSVTQDVTKLVSEITRPPHRTDGSPESEVTRVVPGWRMSPTLAALQELIDVAEAAPGVVARQAGLSTSELHSLRHLAASPMGPVELAKHLGVTSAASSGVVDRLVSRGHAERRPHPEDKRRTEVVITPSGRAEVLSRLAPMFAALAGLDQDLTEEEQAVVERYLRGAIDAMRRLG